MKPRVKPPGRIVEVEWIDTYTLSSWREKSEMEAPLNTDPGGMPTVTIGYLLRSSRDRIVVCQSGNTEGATCAVIVIPRGCVTAIRRR